MPYLEILLAATIGLALGMLGGGGSILTVPAFVYLLGIEPKAAIAMSLVVVGTAALAGAASHWRSGNVRPRTAITFGMIAMIGAFAGARVAVFIPAAIQLIVLGIVLLAAAASMLRPIGARPAGAGAPLESRDPRRSRVSPRLMAVALAVGALTGVVGVGGGFLIVPALVLLGGVPMKEAVGTSLLVIALNSAAGFAGYYGTVAIDWPFVAGFTAVAVGGILAGSYLTRFIPADTLKRAFAILLIFIGAYVLFQSRAMLSI